MKFVESGLPKNKLIEEAFNFSFKNQMSCQDEFMKDFTRQIGQMHAQQLMMLDADKAAGLLSDEEYKQQKAMMEREREEQMKVGPQLVQEELKNNFKQRRIAPAQELCKHSANASPELLAAIILIECVRSPVDFLAISKQFGDGVGLLVAQMQHIDAYPNDKDKSLAASNSDVKRAYMALLVTSLENILAQVQFMAKVSPTQKVIFYAGQEETLFGSAKVLWGNDKKLDTRFLEVFNKAAEVTSSVFRMEADAKGDLELTKGNIVPPRDPKIKPPAPGTKTGLGDDVF